ncbi:unnamed protein product [Polarella glacialis]|uniref:Uncharacterized protein n=1 Tax=Polarella glacialis TaxID=89957 RepID=A0A813F3R2_POLGL|nr:unnamed protein product [Polarella glacialis]
MRFHIAPASATERTGQEAVRTTAPVLAEVLDSGTVWVGRQLVLYPPTPLPQTSLSPLKIIGCRALASIADAMEPPMPLSGRFRGSLRSLSGRAELSTSSCLAASLRRSLMHRPRRGTGSLQACSSQQPACGSQLHRPRLTGNRVLAAAQPPLGVFRWLSRNVKQACRTIDWAQTMTFPVQCLAQFRA